MSFNNGPTIVTNGLVLALDAGDRNSYVSGSTTWFDLTGVNNGTLINGPTFNTGSGGSIVFDGVDDYIELGNILNFERTDPFSINSWVNVTSLSVFRTIISKMDSSFKGYAFIIESTGQLTLILRNTPVTNSLFARTEANIISPNMWFNITATYNGNSSPSGVNIYVNSVLYSIQSVQNTLSQSIITTYPLNIGARTSNSDGYMLGRIPQISIYNRALSAQEVLQNYNATKGRFGL